MAGLYLDFYRLTSDMTKRALFGYYINVDSPTKCALRRSVKLHSNRLSAHIGQAEKLIQGFRNHGQLGAAGNLCYKLM